MASTWCAAKRAPCCEPRHNTTLSTSITTAVRATARKINTRAGFTSTFQQLLSALALFVTQGHWHSEGATLTQIHAQEDGSNDQ